MTTRSGDNAASDRQGRSERGESVPAESRHNETTRRAARRRHGRRALSAIVALALLAALASYWLLNSIAGRDLLLRRIVALLPDSIELRWDRAEGPAAGPMTLHRLRLTHRRCPDANGEPVHWRTCATPLVTVLSAERVVLDPALRPLLGRRLRLDALRVENARLMLPESDEPFELPRWPESLPTIALPIALRADAVEVDGFEIVRGDGDVREHVIDIARLRGGVDAGDGRLRVLDLTADTDRGRFALRGDYMPRDRYRMDLTASALLPAAAGRTPARLGLVARGDLHALDVALAGHAPAPLQAQLRLRSDGGDTADARPQWNFKGRSDALSVAALLGTDDDAPPFEFDLRAEGDGGNAELRGRVAYGDTAATILPSRVSLDEQVLVLAPLRVALLDGAVAARGRLDLREPADPQFKGAIAARGLRWRGGDAVAGKASARKTSAGKASAGRMRAGDAFEVVGDGDFRVAGRLRDWRSEGDARLRRGKDAATVALAARGDQQRAMIERLDARTPGGRLDGGGEFGWRPHLRWNADLRFAAFDPGYFLPDWPGAIDGRVRSTGEADARGVLNFNVDARDFAGRLRGRALAGRAELRLRLPARDAALADLRGEGAIALSLGGSKFDASGKVGDALAVDVALSPLLLNDWLPDGRGALRGTLRLRGARTAPDIEVDLAGDDIAYADYAAGRLRAQGRLPWRAGAMRAGALTIDAQAVKAGLVLDALRIDARGAFEDLRLDAQARSEFGALDVSGDLSRRSGRWQGVVDALRYAPPDGSGDWRLQAPARFAQIDASPQRWTLTQSCFRSDGVAGEGMLNKGMLCASADWPTRVDVEGRGLTLAMLAPYLPEREQRDGGGAWRLDGDVDLDAQIRPRGASWQGTAQVRSTVGRLALEARTRREVLGYTDARIDAEFDPQRIEATLAAGLRPEGTVRARIATGWDAYAPLDGEIDIDTRELTWLELFSPDIVDPQGQLTTRLALAGTRAQPALGGDARLSAFRAELPALALELRDGDLRLDARADGSARIAGGVRSGQGTLRVDGTLDWRSDATPLRLSLSGENVLISDTRKLRAVVDPAVEVRYAAGQPIAVVGRVDVSEAAMNLEGLSEGVSASPDVVVLDPANPERGARTPLDLDLALRMGRDVRLRGFGLDGTLRGEVRMRAWPGRETIANGRLDIDGRYTAYGQKLQITRGQLSWSNRPFSDPLLDIRAERAVGAVTAGIDVKGRASAPEASVWSDPATSQSEALSYLALGRPLSTASADENRQLSAAAAALSAGGNLLGAQLAARIGLDDAGVSESRALGTSVVGVGKYLSPRLYVSYGVSLLGTGQVITLKYLLRKGFDIEIESSTLENRGSVNWRHEK